MSYCGHGMTKQSLSSGFEISQPSVLRPNLVTQYQTESKQEPQLLASYFKKDDLQFQNGFKNIFRITYFETPPGSILSVLIFSTLNTKTEVCTNNDVKSYHIKFLNFCLDKLKK